MKKHGSRWENTFKSWKTSGVKLISAFIFQMRELRPRGVKVTVVFLIKLSRCQSRKKLLISQRPWDLTLAHSPRAVVKVNNWFSLRRRKRASLIFCSNTSLLLWLHLREMCMFVCFFNVYYHQQFIVKTLLFYVSPPLSHK